MTKLQSWFAWELFWAKPKTRPYLTRSLFYLRLVQCCATTTTSLFFSTSSPPMAGTLPQVNRPRTFIGLMRPFRQPPLKLFRPSSSVRLQANSKYIVIVSFLQRLGWFCCTFWIWLEFVFRLDTKTCLVRSLGYGTGSREPPNCLVSFMH